MSYRSLPWLRKRVAQSRRLAALFGDHGLVKVLDGHLAEIERIDGKVTSFADGELTGVSVQIEQTWKQVEARLEGEAKAALLISQHKLNPLRCRPEDVLEEAILYRQEAGLTDDPEQRRALGERALELARLAHRMSMASPVNPRTARLRDQAGTRERQPHR